jgi:hypothetical protein
VSVFQTKRVSFLCIGLARMSTYVSGNLVPEAERQKCPHIFGALLTNFEVFRYAALDSLWRIVRIFTQSSFAAQLLAAAIGPHEENPKQA